MVYIGPGMRVDSYSRLPTLLLPPSHAQTQTLSIFLSAQNSHRVKNFKLTSTLCFGWRRPHSLPIICFILKQQSSKWSLRKKDSGMRKKWRGDGNDGVTLGYTGYKVNVGWCAGFGKSETLPGESRFEHCRLCGNCGLITSLATKSRPCLLTQRKCVCVCVCVLQWEEHSVGLWGGEK